uniref:Transcription repressor n=1 Tax=Kalanchoe fedtschenkoi TaxID=63787 RepID=A0A7N0SYE1_KALFE
MPGSAINSCFPKIKRPQPQPDLRGPPFPVFLTSFKHEPPCRAPPLHSGHEAPTTPDLSAAYASGRFFISSPGQSNSIVDSSAASSSSSFGSDTSVMKNSVAVPTYSPDPYADFRRSMEEMVEAREGGGFRQGDKRGTGSWEYLHELLLCYLALNPKATHKFIIGAFADLVVDHMSAASAPPAAAIKRRQKAAVDVIKGSRLK